MLSMMRSGVVDVLRFVAILTASAATAQAQCGEWDNRFGIPVGTNNRVFALTLWDPDGVGPQPAQLVAGGYLTSAGGVPASGIARWDGSAWQPFGSGVSSVISPEVFDLTTWDPDGDGPLAAQLVAGGNFITAGGVTVNSIARWDGSAWQPFGSGMSGGDLPYVHALTTWDPDGDGPLAAQLVAGGSFANAGGVTVNNLARWDGSAWQPLGTGTNGSVRSLTMWDPDGDGPLPAQLVAGGNFTTAGGVPVNRIARWDGSAWQPIGGGMDGGIISPYVSALTTWDPDGDGPLAAQLVAGGSFTTAGGVMVNNIARWDGASWLPFGSGMSGGALPYVTALSTWDPDGPGPQPTQLVAGGTFTTAGGVTMNYIARWDGSEWHNFGSGMSLSVDALTAWDPDGDGPLTAQLVAGGDFDIAGGVTVNYIAQWGGSAWQALGNGMNSSVETLTSWDPDGDGLLPVQLVAGGTFTTAGGVTMNRVARWDGSAWQALGAGMNNRVETLMSWDPDGNSPLPAQLVAGGDFTTADGIEVNRIARWDGATWQPFGSGMNSRVWSLITWDPDGDGPLPAQLVAGGSFTTAGGVTVNNVARWDGATWLPFGSGMDDTVLALTTWDPDGVGPLAAQLVAAGDFSTAGGVTVNRVALWDGSAWQPIGSGMNARVDCLTTWDPDGAGPLAAQLVAGGGFTTAGGVTVNRVALWDGSAWQSFGIGLGGASPPPFVFDLTTWDPDGDGPLGAQLVAGGLFITAGGVTANGIARWDGSSWQSFASGLARFVFALTTWDPDGSGPQPTQLVAGGSFTTAGDIAAGSVALWSNLLPEILQQPVGDTVAMGATVVLGITARNGQPAYQWRKGGLDLMNGPTGTGSVIYGATTPTLTITAAQPSDSDNYDCIITNSCGEAVSDEAIISITPPPSCGGDANGDNQVDGADLSVLLFLFGQSVTPGTAADFNGDGLVNGADLSVLLGRFGTAC